MRLVFSNGKWVSVPLPIDSWTEEYIWYYSTIYAACLAKHTNISPQKASSIAEAAVYKRMYPDLSYNTVLEGELRSLFD
jgi:hypothetical protein